MATSGRKLLVAFVAGALAASLLLALPLFTIREKVEDVQHEQHQLERRIVGQAGQELIQAGQAVASGASEPVPGPFATAHRHVATAAALANLTEPANGSLVHALTATGSILDRFEQAAACQVLSPSLGLRSGLEQLAGGLDAIGAQLGTGERPRVGMLAGIVSTLEPALSNQLSDRGITQANLTIDEGTATVRVTLTGGLPASTCRGDLTIEACTLNGTEPVDCIRTAATSPEARLAQGALGVPAPVPTDETTAVRVTMRDVQLGFASEDTCELEPEDGARCQGSA